MKSCHACSIFQRIVILMKTIWIFEKGRHAVETNIVLHPCCVSYIGTYLQCDFGPGFIRLNCESLCACRCAHSAANGKVKNEKKRNSIIGIALLFVFRYMSQPILARKRSSRSFFLVCLAHPLTASIVASSCCAMSRVLIPSTI